MTNDPLDGHDLAWWHGFPTELRPGRDPKILAVIDETENSLRDFIRHAWPILEPATPFIANWHLDAVCDHLEAVTNGDIRNLLINIPPRHMKSLAVGVFWPAWEWITFPSRRFLFASYAMSLSERDSLKCRRLMESPWYQQHFGNIFQLCGDQNTKLRYENDKAGHRIATSVGGSATGEGGDRVVVDDPHNVIDRESNAKRIETLVWWDETMSTRLNDPKTGAKIIVMQRIHEKDLSGHVLQQGGYTHLFLPAEFEPGRRCVTKTPAGILWSDPRTEDNELLWRERIGPAEIADYKIRLGPAGYAGQFQQHPAPAGGAVFKVEWFRYYSVLSGTGGPPVSDVPTIGEASDFTRSEHGRAARATTYTLNTPGLGQPVRVVSAKDCRRFAVMDPAGTEPGEGRRPCFTVIQVWDVTPTGDMLLVHQYRRQVQTPQAAEAAARISRDFEVDYILIEKDGIGLGVVQHVKNMGVTVRPIKARGPKESRTQTAEIRMSAGQIFLPRHADYLFDLEQELIQFPTGEFCDQVDALAHAAMEVQRTHRIAGAGSGACGVGGEEWSAKPALSVVEGSEELEEVMA